MIEITHYPEQNQHIAHLKTDDYVSVGWQPNETDAPFCIYEHHATGQIIRLERETALQVIEALQKLIEIADKGQE